MPRIRSCSRKYKTIPQPHVSESTPNKTNQSEHSSSNWYSTYFALKKRYFGQCTLAYEVLYWFLVGLKKVLNAFFENLQEPCVGLAGCNAVCMYCKSVQRGRNYVG